MHIRWNLCRTSIAHLVLEDGTVFSGRQRRRARRRRGRGLLHDRDDRLRGGGHRPELRRAGALLRLPADRHLRRRRVAHGVRPGAVRGRRHAGRPARVRRAGCASRASSRSTASTRATLVRKIRDGGVLRCALGDAPVEELHARALAEPPIDGRPLDRQRRRARAVLGRRRPAGRRRRPRLEALDPAPARRGRARGLRRARRLGRRRDPRRRAARRADRERPGRPGRARRARSRPSATLLGRVPLFGVCLGHQLLGLALGHETFKLPFGHRGANHPVRDVRTGRVLVTVQNHGFAVLGETATVSHVSLNDGTCEGLAGDGFESVQFHPEASPGPLDALPFFDRAGRHVPKRTDLRSILILGSGPIRIGQACEFDYSGAQACRVLRREGYRVVLVNSNPATIMTDPEWADATYLEPLDAETVAEVIERERPDAILPTLGGQTALNLAVELARLACWSVRRRADRRRPGRDPARRGPRALPRRRCTAVGLPDAARASSSRSVADVDVPGCRRSSGRRSRSAAPAAGSPGRRRSCARAVAARPRGEPGRPGARRGVPRRLAGARARGDVRRARQLRRRLLDREPRPDGRPHRRLVDGGAAADAARPDLPAAARGGLRDARARSASRPAARTSSSRTIPRAASSALIEMNPRVSRSSALASKATGLPDREAGGAARRRLHARRAAERHHRQDDGRVRAGARLRRGQGAALRLREVPGRVAASSARRCAPSARRSGSGGRSRRRS